MNLNVVILAAGQGKRMHSSLPKVLHRIAGQSLLGRVIDTARCLLPASLCIVYGHGGDAVRAAFPDADLSWALQEPQLGTGHAVQQALPLIFAEGTTLVLYGDVPLIQPATLRRLLAASAGEALAVLTVAAAEPRGYGRIVRSAAGDLLRIVEEKDASAAERAIREVNSGIMAIPSARLAGWLAALSSDNAQGEYYLTDLVAAAVADGVPVNSAAADGEWEVRGVNSKQQLAELERLAQAQIAAALLDQGVQLADPARLDVRGELICGRDVFIDVNCVFEGRVELADGVSVGANCVIKDARIGAGSRINPFSHIDGAALGSACVIGPYARLRPGCDFADAVHVGNFVEVKNSRIGAQSKANHLSYLGDAEIGERVNVGAGSITCNYDGASKHRTLIEDDAFIGSGTQLVAPVSVGRGTTIGAGTTLTKDAPPHSLTVARSKQVSLSGWRRPQKED